jgi:hypothetical protein
VDANEARALVRIAPQDNLVRLRIGEEIGGWKVTQIDGRKLVVSRDDRSKTFVLFDSKDAETSPRLPAGAPARTVERQIASPPAASVPAR